MRIALVMAGDEEGGLESHVIALANALAERHEVHVIAHPKYVARLCGVTAHALDMTRGRRNPRLWWQLLKLLRRIRPELVHAQANKAAALVAAVRWGLPRGCRRVATLHSEKRRVAAFTSFELVIGVSRRVLKPLTHPRTRVIYNGVSVPPRVAGARALVRRSLGLAADAPVILAVARLVEVKRLDQLIEACAALDQGHLVVAGEGPLREALQAQARRLAPGRIHLLGQRDDVPDLLAATDICALSSEREGFPYIVAEALLHECPVIATDVSDLVRLLPADRVVPVNDVEALRAALARALAAPEMLRADYAPVFAWARENLSFGRMVAATEAVYKELCDGAA